MAERELTPLPWQPMATACVYVIEAVGTGHVKIGLSTGDATKRLAALQANTPHELRLLVVIRGVGRAYERECHERFAKMRIRREWFDNRGELTAWINRMKLAAAAVEGIAEAYTLG